VRCVLGVACPEQDAMGVGGRDSTYPVGCPNPVRSDAMSEQSTAASAATAFDHASTLVLALELSGKGWEVGAVLPGVSRRPRCSLAPRDMAGLLRQIERWKAEALRAGRTVQRTVLGYEAGRDGLWIARYLIAHGIAVQIMHPASIPVERRGRRAKTDRIDLDMLLRTLLAWLRGEPRVCSMVCIPSEAGEDARRPERERERRVSERIALENRVENLLCLHGITGFKPRLKRAIQRLDELRRFDGTALPAMLLEELRRLMARHRVLSDQLREIEAAREQVAMAATPDRTVQQIQMLSRVRGLGLATASGVVREVFCRSFADRKAIAGFVGLTGTPFNSGARNANRASAKTAIRGCAVSCCSWLGVGCASSRTVRSVAGSSNAPAAPTGASARLWWWHSPVSCWWRCGAMSRPASCRPACASPPHESRRDNRAQR
jgi:transposase